MQVRPTMMQIYFQFRALGLSVAHSYLGAFHVSRFEVHCPDDVAIAAHILRSLPHEQVRVLLSVRHAN